MPRTFPTCPAVSAALAQAGKHHLLWGRPLSDEQREMAARFDVANALTKAMDARRAAGLPAPGAWTQAD